MEKRKEKGLDAELWEAARGGETRTKASTVVERKEKKSGAASNSRGKRQKKGSAPLDGPVGTGVSVGTARKM